ncbi:hypothetical protein QJS10_CPA03g00838 [Acorus calamus]|uniref:Uncharacterized protein n=1 Tax=Acorus calamus TaxID=4465 RepID=A0AAV9F5Q4_ACOCL|nr:hypothetical protein QJS10_CPA03g00838 [Acorus calamus]
MWRGISVIVGVHSCSLSGIHRRRSSWMSCWRWSAGCDEGDKSGSAQFKAQVSRLYQELLMEFTVKGADCDEFLEEKVKGLGPKPATLDTTLKL